MISVLMYYYNYHDIYNNHDTSNETTIIVGKNFNISETVILVCFDDKLQLNI